MNEQHPNPADFAKSAALVSGVSPEQLRQNLVQFNADIVARQLAAVVPPQEAPILPPPAQQSGYELPMPSMPLDYGYAQPVDTPPPVDYTVVVVTGVMNGVAASGNALYQDAPTPL